MNDRLYFEFTNDEGQLIRFVCELDGSDLHVNDGMDTLHSEFYPDDGYRKLDRGVETCNSKVQSAYKTALRKRKLKNYNG